MYKHLPMLCSYGDAYKTKVLTSNGKETEYSLR